MKDENRWPDYVAPLDRLLSGNASLSNLNGPNGLKEFIQASDLLNDAPDVTLGQKLEYPPSYANPVASFNTLDASGVADMLFKPKKSGAEIHHRIIDFKDSICQRDGERLLAEHGITRLLINYGPKRLKLHCVSAQQYVINRSPEFWLNYLILNS